MDGVVTLLKPPGMTSSNAVYDARHIFAEKRAGHLGTLDPGAAGVLPICLGRATRLFDLLVDKQKEYVFEVTFGTATDTQDAYGRVVARASCDVDNGRLIDALPSLTGTQMQTASVYSALKVGGKKMCDLARAGAEVTPKSREITIYELTLIEKSGRNRFLLRVRCSRGTYVRSLCVSLGDALGVPAYMSFLLRTSSGQFTLSDAHTVEELTKMQQAGELPGAVKSVEDTVAFLPAVTLPEDRLTAAKNALETHMRGLPSGDVRLYCADTFLGVGASDGRSVKLKIHLY